MTSTAIEKVQPSNEALAEEASVLEAVIVGGDLAKLNSAQRIAWYRMRCDAADLDYRTQPFSYITLQNKLTLYATKTATEQLCEKRGLSCEIVSKGFEEELYVVHARVYGKDGRKTDNVGAVTVGPAKGDQLANAIMKAITKAFRRAVLSHCGLGMLDETETETIPGAQHPPFGNGAGHESIDNIEAQSTDDLRAMLADMKASGHPQKRDVVEELRRRKEEKETAAKATPETPVESTPVEGEVVQESEAAQSSHSPAIAAIETAVGDTEEYRAFVLQATVKNLSWQRDADVDAFGGAYSDVVGTLVRPHQLNAEDWLAAANLIESGELSW